MTDYSTIWEQLEQLQSTTPDDDNNQFICNCCGGVKVFTDVSLTCSSCGIMENMCLDETAEWLSSEGKDDPARCGMATDNVLYSENWGASTVIKTSNPRFSRMAILNMHSSMSYQDRALYHTYSDLDQIIKDKLNLPDALCREIKRLYKTFNESKLTRGSIRGGIKANCVMSICKKNKVPRTTKEIAIAFGIPTKDISRTFELFKQFTNDEQTCTITKPVDILNRLLSDMQLSDDSRRLARTKATQLANRLDECIQLMGKSPQSIAAAIIMRILGDDVPRELIVGTCKVSVPTLMKLNNIISNYLEE